MWVWAANTRVSEEKGGENILNGVRKGLLLSARIDAEKAAGMTRENGWTAEGQFEAEENKMDGKCGEWKGTAFGAQTISLSRLGNCQHTFRNSWVSFRELNCIVFCSMLFAVVYVSFPTSRRTIHQLKSHTVYHNTVKLICLGSIDANVFPLRIHNELDNVMLFKNEIEFCKTNKQNSL